MASPLHIPRIRGRLRLTPAGMLWLLVLSSWAVLIWLWDKLR